MVDNNPGKLGLDDPVGRHLDGLPAPWQPLTLKQLLTHTSGLKDWESAHLLSFRREYTPAEFIEVMSPFPLDFPAYRMSNSSRTAVTAQLSGLKAFVFLDREDDPGDDGSPHSGSRLLRYKLASDQGTYYYTFQMTDAGRVADVTFEDE